MPRLHQHGEAHQVAREQERLPHDLELLRRRKKEADHDNVVGPVKATLDASVRYLAREFRSQSTRVNANSVTTVLTRVASGIEHFDEILNEAVRKAALRRLVDSCDIGGRRCCGRATAPSRTSAKRSTSIVASTSRARPSTVRSKARGSQV